VVQALLLRFQPPNLDVLPLYIVLLATFPPVLWLLRRSPTLALGASAALYGLTWQFDWKFATYPDGAWFFNPLAWQLIFTFGAWCALGGAARLARLIHSWPVLSLAVAYLVFSFAISLTWYSPALDRRVPVLVKIAPDLTDAQLDAVRQKGRAEVRAILTSEQLPKFEEFLKRMDEERKRNGPKPPPH